MSGASAYERLKRLNILMQPWSPPPATSLVPEASRAAYDVLSALPQIMAVVESAEEAYAILEKLGGPQRPRTLLHAALTALDEALS